MMYRKVFVVMVGLILCGFNSSLFQFSEDLLIGKGNPTFYGEGYQLQEEAHNAFLLMKAEALKSGINIQVVSSYRGFEHQKRIWTRKYKRFTDQGLSPEKAIAKIIEYSTIPGTSRHHWGTDLDIIDGAVPTPTNVLEPENFEEGAVFYEFKKWMDVHANSFGFYLVYTDEPSRKGFKYEPWHFSYKPISKSMLQDYKSIDIKELLSREELVGSSYFTNEFISRYSNQNIFDINPQLK